MSALSALPLIVFPALLIVAALKDVVSFTIPNWISAALLALFPVAALSVGLSWGEFAQHAAVGGVALVIGMTMFALNWIGGGDAKLFTVSALWLGFDAAPAYLAYTAVAGGALAVGLLSARKAVHYMPVAGGPSWVKTLLDPKGDIPYGIALAVGALCAAPRSPLLAGALPGLG